LRAIFIFAGVALIEKFDWILYVFGAFLLYTAAKLIFGNTEENDPRDSKFLKLVNRFVPSTDEYDGQKLFTRKTGRRLATPLFAVLVLIEGTDVIFAVDSVPAVLAVSHEQFIVFASNAFAILGLRALYFLLADMHARFTYLQQGLAVILAFVGVKMLIAEWYHIPTWASLSFIAIVLAGSIIISLQVTKRQERTALAGQGIEPGPSAVASKPLPVEPESSEGSTPSDV
jgi:tellurite resistance protein TerC